MKLLNHLLMKNVSGPQLAGFILSNLTGLAIVMVALQLYADLIPIWNGSDSFLKKDYLVVNKKVTRLQQAGSEEASFSDEEIDELRLQPWVRSVGEFTAADYRVTASVGTPGNNGMTTYMFLESLPTQYVDVAQGEWYFNPDNPDAEVPIIISKDYLALYNFGFAASAGMPQISEGMLGSVPMRLTISNENATRSTTLRARISGFSSRLNTILVPGEFMQWASSQFGSGQKQRPSRLIIDVSSPGDAAINTYISNHQYEIAGDKKASSATYLVNIITMAIISIGAVIITLSFFILFLSISLLMQKHREKLRTLIFLGYPLGRIATPYYMLITIVSCSAFILSAVALLILRHSYLPGIESLGGGGGGIWLSIGCGALLTLLSMLFNILAVGHRIRKEAQP